MPALICHICLVKKKKKTALTAVKTFKHVSHNTQHFRSQRSALVQSDLYMSENKQEKLHDVATGGIES